MKKLMLILSLGILVQMSYAQSKVINFLVGGTGDANALVQAYLNPYALALGDGLNNGWYNSAETHKLFGFDLSFSVSAIQIPQRATTFDLNNIGLTKLKLEDPAKHIAPTIAGKDVEGPRLVVNDTNGNPISSFSTPSGLGMDILPVPVAQIGFGLLPHTDILIRWVPTIKYDNNGDQMKLGLWGLGVKHNFKEWIPILKNLPFDASVFASYSNINAQSGITLDPNDFSDENVKLTFADDHSQLLKYNTKTTKLGLILSKKIGVLTIFGGIGHSTSKTAVDLLGKYIIETTFTSGGQQITTKDNLNDPISLNIESKKLSMDIGLRLKLGFFSLFTSVNKAEYASYNGGMSFGFR